jgi:hypothetical protein
MSSLPTFPNSAQTNPSDTHTPPTVNFPSVPQSVSNTPEMAYPTFTTSQETTPLSAMANLYASQPQ